MSSENRPVMRLKGDGHVTTTRLDNVLMLRREGGESLMVNTVRDLYVYGEDVYVCPAGCILIVDERPDGS